MRDLILNRPVLKNIQATLFKIDLFLESFALEGFALESNALESF